MESLRAKQDSTNLKRMVDEYVIKHMPLEYILGKLTALFFTCMRSADAPLHAHDRK